MNELLLFSCMMHSNAYATSWMKLCVSMNSIEFAIANVHFIICQSHSLVALMNAHGIYGDWTDATAMECDCGEGVLLTWWGHCSRDALICTADAVLGMKANREYVYIYIYDLAAYILIEGNENDIQLTWSINHSKKMSLTLHSEK